MPQKLGRLLFALTAFWLLCLISACQFERASAPPDNFPIDSSTIIPSPFGKGVVSFDGTGIVGLFRANGPYRQSAQFLNDTVGSHGAGGFLLDTTFFGRPVNVTLAAYTNTFSRGRPLLRLLSFAIRGSEGTFPVRIYPFVGLDNTTSPNISYITLTLLDSANFFNVFIGRTGATTIGQIDTTSRRISGLFTGTFVGPYPDTTTQFQISRGFFDIEYIGRFFAY